MNDDDTNCATEAFIYGLPLYEMSRMRAATSPRRIDGFGHAGDGADSTMRWCNVFIHARKLLAAGTSRVVTPNNDTLYTNAWLDLGAGPLVIDVPDTDGRYYVLGLLDFFTNPFAHIGQRLTGTAKRSFLVVGPDWRGDVPAEFSAPDSVVRAPTRWVWIIGRILVDGETDLPPVHALQDRFVVRPLGASQSEPKRFDTAFDAAAPMTGERFVRVTGAALRENPPPPTDADWLTRYADVDVKEIDDAIEPALALIRGADVGQSANNGWTRPPLIESTFGTNYLLRAVVALSYIGVLESREAIYPMAYTDAEGAPLTGQHDYRLRFGPHDLPPVDAFWSITMYDKATRMLVDNSIDRYAIGDRTQGLRRDADGGLTVFIGNAMPQNASQRANWLPAPAEPFCLCLRAYRPRLEFLDGSHELPPLQRIDSKPGDIE